jgi:hypothetical protein
MTVTVDTPSCTLAQGHPVVSADIKAAQKSYRIYIRSSQGPLSDRADAFVAAALLPAMRLGAPLTVDGAMSPTLHRNLPTFQQIVHTWYNEYQPVPISAELTPDVETPPPANVGCFFSGGVDSFYTALTHLDEITHLILVHGFDFSLRNQPVRATVSAAIRQAASALGKPLIEVETNLHSLLDEYGHWDFQTHGTAMAAVALAHAGFRKVYFAAPHSYAQLVPLGLHPLTTPLWSTERMNLALHGLDKIRWEKADMIKEHPVVRRWLRVCSKNTDGAYNCNHCDKCFAMRVYIRAVGMQDSFPTFAPLTDLREMAEFASHPHNRAILARMYKHLGARYPAADVIRWIVAALELPPLPGADRVSQLEYEVWQAKEQCAELDAQVRQMRTNNANLHAQLTALHASRSMTLTAPLRSLQAGLARLRRPAGTAR